MNNLKKKTFLYSSFSKNGIVIERSWVHQLISKIVNNPKLSIERYAIVKQLWEAVLNLADDFANAVIQGIYVISTVSSVAKNS